MLGEPIERHRFSDIAFDRVRSAIITGELPPGSRVRDTDLSASLGLSRTPVREALARLAGTGLVEAKPGVHTRVSDMHWDEIEHTLSVLQVLDQLAVSTAVPKLTAADIAEMRQAQDVFIAAVDDNDAAAALKADGAYHGVIHRTADNPVLTRVIDQVHPVIDRVLYRKFSTLLGGHDTIDHHERLLEHCAAGKATQAAGLSAQHWRHLGGLINDLFDAHAFAPQT